MDKIKQITIPTPRGKNIAGRLYQADSKTVVIMAHGFCGDKSAGGRFDKIAEALVKEYYNIINFDFVGCGASDDEILDSEFMVEDLKAVIDYADLNQFENIILYGHSLGGYVCLRACNNKVTTMVMSGALSGPMAYNWTEYFSPEQVAELEANDFLTVPDDSAWRDKIIVGKTMLDACAKINQKELYADINCPVLFIHGNHPDDIEEQMLLANSRKGLELLPAESKLNIIDGADHRFYEHIPQLIENISNWLRNHIK